MACAAASEIVGMLLVDLTGTNTGVNNEKQAIRDQAINTLT